MKNKLLLVGLVCSTGLFGQNELKQLSTQLNVQSKPFPSNSLEANSRSMTCNDTVRYAEVKEMILGTATWDALGLWTSDAEAITHAFLNSSGLTVSGAEFYGVKATSSPNVTTEVALYSVDASNNPVTQLAVGSVLVTATEGYYYVNFPSPVTITSNYALVIRPTTTNGILVVLTNNPVVNSYDENLTKYKSSYYTSSNNAWIPISGFTELASDYGHPINFEPVVSPIVSYAINTTGTVTPTTACLGDEVTFTNTTVFAQQTNRMYSYQAFRQHFLSFPDSTFVWDLDNDMNVNTTPATDLVWNGNTTHTYTSAGTHTPELFTRGGLWNSCLDYATFTVTINPVSSATFSYASSTICEGGANVTPSSVATAGGTFSSTTGLIFADASTGEIDVQNSTAGTYTITYTTAGACPSTSTQTLTITSAPDATFTYATDEFCTSGTNPSPVLTGTAGAFTSTTGLSINASTGVINLATSTAGSYTITNTIAASGTCAASTETFDVEIFTAGNVAFTYPASTYCLSGTNPSPTVTGATGTFTSTTGLSINATGVIDLANSTAGTYTVTNEVAANGACPIATATATITVTANPSAAFTYAESSYCATGSANATVTGTAGTFTSTPAGLSINGTTGAINLASSTDGTYTVTNTIAATATCAQETATATVTVEEVPTATINVGGPTLSAVETGVTYQWINCAGNTPVAGATAQTFTPSAPGSYAVIITDGNCSTTSACQSVSNVGIDDKNIEMVTVYPNPTENTITIGGLEVANAVVTILDVNGRVLVVENTTATTLELSVRDFEAGVYFISVASETINGTKRFIKK